jgi:hypothetical protein
MDIMSQFNLPKYLKGKSFSEASKLIADKFQDRNTPEDQATLKELQGRLRSAQEFVKAKQEAATQPQEPMHQMPDGTMMPGATHGEAVQEQSQQPQVDPAMMQEMMKGMPPQEGAYGHGGYMKKKMYAYGGKMDRENAANKYEHGGPHDGFGSLSKFLFNDNGSLNTGVDSSRLNGLNAAQYIQNDGLGNMPLQGSRTLPFSPGFSSIGDAFNAQEEAAQKAKLQSDYEARKNKLSNPVTTLETYGVKSPGAKSIADQALLGIGKENNFLGTNNAIGSEKSIFSGNDTNEEVNKARQSKFNPGELLRYAAPVSTALQLKNLKKPKDVSLGRMTDKYDEQFVDEKAMQNVVEGQAANTRGALQNASGGSAAALRANLLGSQLQSQAAMGQAYNQAAAENRNERRQAQQFNSAVNQANMSQADKEKEMNLAMQAGYDTNRSRLMAQLGADFSGIGQEELFKRFPELAGLGYDYKGRKIT